ncbi:GMC family oxidoreductase [Rhodoligotrophos ferricapiens]|uniref:GMC family oxidoreductase n=1 Tax=Rhodoligotrophos ferricapiens TaxID=3069264 RepID=UPI00315D6B43
MAGFEFDYVIIGSGAAGAVIASRLSEDPSAQVLLLEAGPAARSPFFRIPGLGFLVSSNAANHWGFTTEPIAELDNRQLGWLQGRVLGGSSSINGMIYTRGHSSNYDRWAAQGCTGWSFAELLPYFRKAEANLRGADTWHGADGPLKIEPSRSRLGVYDAFLAAVATAGHAVVDDLNADVAAGFGRYDTNTWKGRRMSIAEAYLRPSMQRPNLTVWTESEALKIIVEGARARGVLVERAGELVELRCRREVVLSGGAIKSPHLLMLSGIGPADELRRHGIPVIIDNPAVGANLQNHPSFRLQYSCSKPVSAALHLTPLSGARALIDYAISRRGVLGDSIFGAGGFLCSEPGLDIADIQVVMAGALMPSPAKPNPGFRDMLPREHGFSLIVYQGTPYSRGRVRLRSASPKDKPIIEAGYFNDPRDLPILLKGIQRVRDIVRQKPMAEIVRAELHPAHARNDAELATEIRRSTVTSFHQSGTCRMGGDDAVLDPALRVRGIDGLRVADASVMPVMPNAALHAPTIMIGEKAASLISGRI